MRAPVLFCRLSLCVLVICCAACTRPKGTPLGAGQLFFEQIRRGETKSAFENSSFTFQSQQNLKFFNERLHDYGLDKASVVLTPISEEPALSKYNAAFTGENGIKYNLILGVQLEEKAWRVYSLRSPRNPKTGRLEDHFSIIGRPPTISSALVKRVPSDEEVRKLVDDSMLLFSDAIVTETFSEFYDFASVAWQKELTEQKLKNAFQTFLDRKMNMTGIMKFAPKFDDPPEIGSDGYLAVAGYYPTSPYEVHFKLRYIFELPDWKLLGLNCYLRNLDEEKKAKPGATPAPAAAPQGAGAPPPREPSQGVGSPTP